MTLQQRINEDLKRALKSGDKIRLETIRSIRASLLEREIAKRGLGGMTPEDEFGVLNSAVKKRRESIEMFEKGGRLDLVKKETEELSIIQEYLPKQLDLVEIRVILQRIITEVNAKSPTDFGKVMGVAMKELKGKADGKIVQEMAKSLLEGNE